jgi:hypothetical protein
VHSGISYPVGHPSQDCQEAVAFSGAGIYRAAAGQRLQEKDTAPKNRDIKNIKLIDGNAYGA